MVSVPNTTRVWLIYESGVGTATIGAVSPLSGKFLALYGEGGGEISTPQLLLVLPASINETKEVANPSDEEISTAFHNNHVLGTPTHRANTTRQTQSILKIAPIPPAYLVYADAGFDDKNDLEAAEIYERIRSGHHQGNATTHAQAFLCLCLVGPWRISDEKPFFFDTHTFNTCIPLAGHTGHYTIQINVSYLDAVTTCPHSVSSCDTAWSLFCTRQLASCWSYHRRSFLHNGTIQLNIDQLCQLVLLGNGAAAIAATKEKKDDE